ncbi:accessory secretory protein Asp1 [Weissella uvarum]|uniref:accessory Sec system glycosyltransferase Asp1 n=1 Tax=Weissella uvarum TaxID=1479233 RepID=UPI001961578B|nr:accessory Sec system glycosyltransferase Asp1 [Weissella uvarum]MBM7616676.1 accessory secretory protein Asp1 [Weissella uvarum]MCM0594870.1 accessory Sec system glycosyltransferase Asp1 [Weissella uvarum]
MALLIPNFDQTTSRPEFDPAIVVADMFEDNALPNQLVFVDEQPELRWMLRQAHLEQLDWWNVFDVIQQVEIRQLKPVMVRDIMDMAEYEPFMNDAETYYYDQQGRKVCHVRLKERQFVTTVEVFLSDGGQLVQYYDDRGFLSYQEHMAADGTPLEKTWYTPAGETVMTQHADGKVDIAKAHQARFVQVQYPNLDKLIAEQVNLYLDAQTNHRTLIADMNHPALKWLNNQPRGRLKKFLILMQAGIDVTQPLPAQAELIFPSQQAQDALTEQQPLEQTSHVLAQYPTTLDLGTSNEQAQTIVYLRYATYAEQKERVFIETICQMVADDDRLVFEIDFETVDVATSAFQAKILAWIGQYYAVNFSSEHYQRFEAAFEKFDDLTEAEMLDFLDAQTESDDEPLIDEDEQEKFVAAYQMRQRINFVVQRPEDEQQDILHVARLYIDLHAITDQRTQMLAVSAGIPQIVMGENELIENWVNGVTVSDIDEVVPAMDYFLSNMQHWNQAVVTNVEKIDQYSETVLVHAWEEVMHDGQ